MANIYDGRERLIVASETNYGADEVDLIFGDGARDIVYLYGENFVIKPKRDTVEIGGSDASASGRPHVSIPRDAQCSGKFFLNGRRGAGAGEEEPTYAPILASAHLEPTIVGATSASYRPRTQAQPGATWYLYHLQDNGLTRLQRATGVRGNIKFVFNLNEPAFFEFTGKGRYTEFLSSEGAFINADGEAVLRADRTTAVVARTTGQEFVDEKQPFIVSNVTVNVGGVPFCIENLEILTNWAETLRRCMSGVSALEEVILSRATKGNRIGGSFTFTDSVTTNIDEIIRLFETADETTLDMVLIAGDGSPGSERMTVNGIKLQLGDLTFSTNGQIKQFDVPFFLNGDRVTSLAADNEFTILYDSVP